MKRARWLGILGILLGSIVISFMIGEGLFRIIVSPEYKTPMLLLPGEERQVPAADIYFFMRTMRDNERMGAGAAFRPYLFLKGWYDRPIWDYFDKDDCVDYLFNCFGFRDDDFEKEKKPDEFRVIGIGDSFTLGVGVQKEHCWTEVLEESLEKDLKKPVQVINAGFAAGHMPVSYDEWIKSDALAFNPDMILIAMCVNDLHPGIELLACVPPVIHKPWLGGYSEMLYRFQKFLACRKKKAETDFSRRVKDDPDYWNKAKAALVSSNEFLKERGIRFAVVFLPAFSGLKGDYPYAGLYEIVEKHCAENQIEHIDILGNFLGLDDEPFWVHPTDQHPNPEGHRMIGESIAEYLLNK